jgi:hypothetical protein
MRNPPFGCLGGGSFEPVQHLLGVHAAGVLENIRAALEHDETRNAANAESTSSGSSTGGKLCLHAPQRPASDSRAAGTRFFRPQ